MIKKIKQASNKTELQFGVFFMDPKQFSY